MDTIQAQETRAFSTLRRLYLLALSAIAVSIILSQVLVQSFLSAHSGDAREINIAGRQRMLSQKLTKIILQLTTEEDHSQIKKYNAELTETLDLWTASHELLIRSAKKNHSTAIQVLYNEISPFYSDISSSVQSVLDSDTIVSLNHALVQKILRNEPHYLKTMDGIVNNLDNSAEKRVKQLRRLEIILLIIALLILFLEIIFLFRPAAIKIDNTLEEVRQSKAALLSSNKKLVSSNNEKKQAFNQLNTLNNAIEQAVLFAFLDESNKIVYISSELKKTFGITESIKDQHFFHLITSDPLSQEQVKKLINQSNYKVNTQEINIGHASKQTTWIELTVIPILEGIFPFRKMILFNNINERKEIQRQLDKIKEEQFENKIKEQQLTSLLVIEAQEAERKRIARDLHDGIGQTLTALKFSIESVDAAQDKATEEKINLIKKEVIKLIREVRFTSFNLTPPELNDYGLETAVEKLVNQLNQISNTQINYINLSTHSKRFDTIIETNLYRIVQEAVNNALKYAGANIIEVKYQLSEEMLSISIIDDGKGFDIDKKSYFGNKKGGMGLKFMKERVNYLKGRIFFNSYQGTGTKITVNIPNENLYLTPIEDRMKST